MREKISQLLGRPSFRRRYLRRLLNSRCDRRRTHESVEMLWGFPELAVAEVFRIASFRPRQIDALVCTRSFFRRRYYPT